MSIVSARAVSMTIGTVEVRRIARQTSRPSSLGSMMSSRTRSNGSARKRSRPSLPSAAVSTVNPALRRPIAVTSRIDGSSSMSRIRASTPRASMAAVSRRPAEASWAAFARARSSARIGSVNSAASTNDTVITRNTIGSPAASPAVSMITP